MSFIKNGCLNLDLDVSDTGLAELERFYRKLASIELSKSHFGDLPEPQRIPVFFLLAALEKVAPELEKLPLNRIFEKSFAETERSCGIFATLSGSKTLQSRRKLDITEIDRLRARFDTFKLLHLGLQRIGDKFFTHPEDLKLVWVLLLFVTEVQREVPDFEYVIDFLGTLLAIVLQRRKPDIDIENFLQRFFDHYKYKITRETFDAREREVRALVPDINSPDLSAETYKQKYSESLGPWSISYLCFLYSVKSTLVSPVVATPVRLAHRSSAAMAKSLLSEPHSQSPKVFTFTETTFSKTSASPDRQLRSSAIKREIESHKYTQNHCEMIEWLRSETSAATLVSLSLPSGASLLITPFFQGLTKSEAVRQNILKITALFKKVAPLDENQFAQFYFRMLENVLRRDAAEEARRESVERVLSDRSFMVSLFALCFELRLFISNPTRPLRVTESVEQLDCPGVFEFYKVLLAFISVCYRQTPDMLKAHLHRLEVMILLRELWVRPRPGQAFAPRLVFSNPEPLFRKIYGKITEIMGERLCIVVGTLGISEDERERLWSTFELLLTMGFNEASTEADFAFKFDTNLDVLLLATIFEWKAANKVYCSLSQLLESYEESVLFPFDRMRENVLEFSRQNKEVLAAGVARAGLPAFVKKSIPNSTPVRSSQAPRKPGALLTDGVLTQMARRSYKDFSAGLSPSSRNALLYTPHSVGGAQMKVFDLGAKNSQNSEMQTDISVILPTSAEPAELATPDETKTPCFDQ